MSLSRGPTLCLHRVLGRVRESPTDGMEATTMAAQKICCRPGEGSRALTRLPQLAKPLLQFNMSDEIRQLHREKSWLRGTGRSSKTLVKHPDFRIVLVAMKGKTLMKEHRAEGRISIHTLVGHIRIMLPDQTVEVPAGELMVLDCGIPHDVEALKESAFLLTISWPKGAPHE
jgi:quercetin dioxygenase-like cupin family protein